MITSPRHLGLGAKQSGFPFSFAQPHPLAVGSREVCAWLREFQRECCSRLPKKQNSSDSWAAAGFVRSGFFLGIESTQLARQVQQELFVFRGFFFWLIMGSRVRELCFFFGDSAARIKADQNRMARCWFKVKLSLSLRMFVMQILILWSHTTTLIYYIHICILTFLRLRVKNWNRNWNIQWMGCRLCVHAHSANASIMMQKYICTGLHADMQISECSVTVLWCLFLADVLWLLAVLLVPGHVLVWTVAGARLCGRCSGTW